MKNKLLTSLILLVSNLAIQAQSNPSTLPPLGKSSFGVFGGINFQNINGKDASGTKLTNSLVTRFHIGVNEELPIAPEFYFQFGLEFISKGTKGPVTYTDGSGTRSITREINMNYLEMPLNFVYKPLVGSGHFILGFGPYVGYCIGGKAKFTGTNPPSDTDLQFEKTAPEGDVNNLVYFKPLDVGANMFFGYQFLNGLSVIFDSQLGLVNINSSTTTKMVNKNTGFGLSLGYRF